LDALQTFAHALTNIYFMTILSSVITLNFVLTLYYYITASVTK